MRTGYAALCDVLLGRDTYFDEYKRNSTMAIIASTISGQTAAMIQAPIIAGSHPMASPIKKPHSENAYIQRIIKAIAPVTAAPLIYQESLSIILS